MTIKEITKILNSEKYDLKGFEFVVLNNSTGQRSAINRIELHVEDKQGVIVINDVEMEGNSLKND